MTLTGALTVALTGDLTGALSDSYSVTTEELLLNRLGDIVLINHSVNCHVHYLHIHTLTYTYIHA